MPDVVIVGAGPAGLSAASVLVEHGVRPTLIDESKRPGGQAYRSPATGLDLRMDPLLGSESRKYHRLHTRFAAIAEKLDYRPETLAWNVYEGEVFTVSRSEIETHGYDALILAPGAVDRLMPIKGWTLPGVYTLGGAQVLLKDQGCLIGRRIVFCGGSPLLYLAALQCRLMGAEVVAVLDTTAFSRKIGAVPKLLASPRTFMRGLGYLAKLRRSAIPVRHGVRALEIIGADSVEGMTYRDAAGEMRSVACDAVALGFGLRPEIQLAELAGCELRYDPVFRQWFPDCDIDGRCGRGLYTAGDGSAIGGADAAELSGMLAAYAVLEDHGAAVPAGRLRSLRRRLKRFRRFQEGLASAFAWPFSWLSEVSDDIVVCRCEGVTAGEVRRVVRAEFGGSEINRVKALSRLGMGRCQGRFCALAAAELSAAELGRPHADFGRLRVQAPVKPLPMSARIEP